MIDRLDSECVVYVLRFEGPVQILFAPERVPTGWIVAKIGRSNDVARRLVELSAGLPPGCGLGWTVLETVRFASAMDAQVAEQALLLSAEQWGWTLGGEFLIAPQETLLAEVCAFASAPILEDA